MSAFRDTAHAADVLGGFFRMECQTDDRIFAGSGIVVAYHLEDPELRIVLDARKTPEPGSAYLVYVNDPAAPEPTVSFKMSADDFDRLYTGATTAMSLMAERKTKSWGDVASGMRLLPALMRSIPHYKEYRKTHGG